MNVRRTTLGLLPAGFDREGETKTLLRERP
jgi:hypothetical protein